MDSQGDRCDGHFSLVRRFLRRLDAMTKKEIVRSISEELGLTQSRTGEIVQKTFDAIIESLVIEGRVELRNFGVFEVKKRAARTARNPKTGDQVEVPPRYVVTFKPGREMEQRVKKLEERDLRAARRSEEHATEATGDSTGDIRDSLMD